MDRDDSNITDRYGERMDREYSESDDSTDGFPEMGVDESVKKEWPAVNMYLPEPLRKMIDDRYRELRYQSGDELQKGRHYYPLIARIGFERVAKMDVEEIRERLEAWEDEDSIESIEGNTDGGTDD